MAFGGLHPVVAVYATFLNRAFDQVLMDVALHRAGVTFVLDRAGITGDDGPSHHGIWDLSIRRWSRASGSPPRATPPPAGRARRGGRGPRRSDGGALRQGLAAGRHRRPRPDRCMDLLRRTDGEDVLVVAVGAMVPSVPAGGERLSAQGIGVTVVDPRWVTPVDGALPGWPPGTGW